MKCAMRWICVVYILFSGFHALAQDTPSNADCSGATEIEGTSYYVRGVSGPGGDMEISGNALGNAKYFTEEHNSAWFIIVPPYKAVFSMELIPDNPNDDWDFMIYQPSHINYCGQIKDQSLEPVRSNLARNQPDQMGKTGLNSDAEGHFQPAGLNPNYSRSLDVEREGILVLVVDIKENTGSGFNLIFNYEKVHSGIAVEIPKEEESSFEYFEEPEKTVESDANQVNYQFEFYEAGTGKELKCDIEIVGVVREDSVMQFSELEKVDVNIPENSRFYLNVKREGYVFNAEKYKAVHEKAGQVNRIELAPMGQGSKIVLNEIVFRENTTHLLPTSYNALEQLRQFMEEYPTATIEIQGHVNAPGYENEGRVKKFSLKRAEEVKEYLVGEGIDGKRIKVKGMGNEFMIYPTPTTYEEEKANRRVEIEVLSYGQ